MTPPLALSRPPRRVLVVCTRRLGDVLLTTPLLRSLRRAWPQAEIDVLTLRWSASALAGNPDVSRVIALNESEGLATLRALGRPWRYDLSLSTLPSDRSHFLAAWAAPRRVNLLPGRAAGGWWKRALASRHVDVDGRSHQVIQYLRLADALGIPRCNEVVPPRLAPDAATPAAPAAPYVVIHPGAMYPYKRWTAAGWQAVIRWLAGQGLHTVIDIGPGPEERAHADAILAGLDAPAGSVSTPAEVLSFAALAGLIAGARLYLGPDTGVTHLAAATGVPVVGVFGPMNPRTWGPWPQGFDRDVPSPWQEQAPLQRTGPVTVVQGLTHCAPCRKEGCERHQASRADCLDQLPASRVIAAAAAALAG